MPTDVNIWMRRCLDLAGEAQGRGEAAVGALIVRGDTIIAEASEQVAARQDVAAHAERLAIQEACRVLGAMRLTDCALYTNVEPCWLCSYAIRETGLRRVVIGAPVADIGGVTGRYPILTDPAVEGWGPPPEIVWLMPEHLPNGDIPMTESDDALAVRELNHVALHVRDLDASLHFYGTVLGLPPLPRPAFPFGGAWFALGTQELHLITGRERPAGSPHFHYALQVADAYAAATLLTQRGVTDFRGPAPRPDGAVQVFLKDPDGYLIELVSAP